MLSAAGADSSSVMNSSFRRILLEQIHSDIAPEPGLFNAVFPQDSPASPESARLKRFQLLQHLQILFSQRSRISDAEFDRLIDVLLKPSPDLFPPQLQFP